MPTIPDISLRLSIEEIRHSWGPERARILVRLTPKLQQLLEHIKSERWLDAAISYRIHEVTARGPGWLEAGATRLNTTLVPQDLQRAAHLVFAVCTLGSSLPRQLRGFFDSNNQLQAVLLDEIGTLLLYKLSDQLEKILCQQAGTMGLQASGAYNPGDESFDIRLQGTVLELAGGNDIGVTLQGRGILVPHKSLTAVIGLGRKMSVISRAERCARCRTRDRCPHRQDILTGAVA